MGNRNIFWIGALMLLAGCGIDKDDKPAGKATSEVRTGQDVGNARMDQLQAARRFAEPANWWVGEAPFKNRMGTVLISGAGPKQRVVVIDPKAGYVVAIGEVSCKLRAYSVQEARRARTDDQAPTLLTKDAEATVAASRAIEQVCSNDKRLKRVQGLVMSAVARARDMRAEAMTPSGPTPPPPTAREQRTIVAAGAKAPREERRPGQGVPVDANGIPLRR